MRKILLVAVVVLLMAVSAMAKSVEIRAFRGGTIVATMICVNMEEGAKMLNCLGNVRVIENNEVNLIVETDLPPEK